MKEPRPWRWERWGAWLAFAFLAGVLLVEFWLMWALCMGIRSVFELAWIFVRALERAGF